MKHLSLSLLCLILLSRQIHVRTQYLPGEQHKTDSHYLHMREDGSYKYAFDTSNGIETEQSANENNEVAGQYGYVDNNVPYKVKYTAGVQGFQPETLPTVPTNTEIQKQQHISTGYNANYVNHYNAVPTAQPVGYVLNNNYRKPLESEPTFQFVQNALRTMQTQPVQLSFSSQHGFPQRFYNHEVNSNDAKTPTLGALSTSSFEEQKPAAVGLELSQHKLASNIDINVNGINSVRPKTAFDLLAALSESSPQLVVSMTNEPSGSYSYEVPAHHPSTAANYIKN